MKPADNDGNPVPSYPRELALPVVSLSGGKDSLATALLAIERHGRDRVRLQYADTGNEHPLVEEYVYEYLPDALGVTIETVRADFSKEIERKRTYIDTVWRDEGVAEDTIKTALEFLVPTGIPFLDLCVWKGRFPSRRAQFCTQELKTRPLTRALFDIARSTNLYVENWQGVRRDESSARKNALVWEDGDCGLWIHRPIATWTAQDTFDIARRHGIKSNPLYSFGCTRVGCMMCINTSKSEISNVQSRWPFVIEKIEKWEFIVRKCSKRQLATFFFFDSKEGRTDIEHYQANNIRQAVAWSQTSRGGQQFDLEHFMPRSECSSQYGLCE